MRHHIGHFWNLPWPLRALAIGGLAIGGLAIAAGLALLFGFILMWLWNWLMPVIFGLPTISFWQAWGLVLLSHILFKTFPHHDHGREHCRDRFDEERWKDKFHKKFFEESDQNRDTDTSDK